MKKLWILPLLMLTACEEPAPVPPGGKDGGVDAGEANDGGRRAFLTSSQYTGNLKIAGNASTSGYTGANSLCARHAADAGLGGEWVAFVGSQTGAPATRVPGSGPWSRQLSDGGRTVVIVSLSSAPVASVDVDETGAAAMAQIWSGRAGPACSDWHSESGSGSIASPNPGAGKDWQNVGTRACDVKLSLLCLEQ